MRDLVETVIGQVLKQQPKMKLPVQQPENDAFGQHVRVEKGVEVKDEKLWGACCQFEAVFLQQMLTAMRKTIPESKVLAKGYADGMYEGMMDQAIAKSGSQQAPLGLALNMYRQLQASGAESATVQEVQRAADKLQYDKPITLKLPGGQDG
ncbi:MAG: rod-binding protein [Mariprofundaceae bacterium]|nr:rod-binding protein [Mariprofundaceae bacterium]